MDLDWIELDDFRICCIVGVLEREQREAQTIELVLRLGLDLRPAASGDLGLSVNYAEVADQAEFIAKTGQWRLLESLGAGIAQLVLSDPAPQERRATVERIEVLMRKPEILGDQATPAVRLHRSREFRSVNIRTMDTGIEVETLVQTYRRGAYRVHLAPGKSWRPPAGAAIHLIAGGLRHDGKDVTAGVALTNGQVGELTNVDQQAVSLLVVGRPLA